MASPGPIDGSAPANRGWDHLLKLAASSVRDDRHAAILRGHAWLEHALYAAGIERQRTVVQTIHRAETLGRVDLHASNLWSGTKYESGIHLKRRGDVVHQIVQSRHRAAHLDVTPSPEECTLALRFYLGLWEQLRKPVVTRQFATELARGLSRIEGITDVFLFGSMSRNEEAHDIDYLLLDTGKYSTGLFDPDEDYQEGDHDGAKRTLNVLDAFELNLAQLTHMAKCRWLDILLLDGSRFGISGDYTLAVQRRQADPHFFEHIAPELMKYDRTADKFKRSHHAFFSQLHDLSIELDRVCPDRQGLTPLKVLVALNKLPLEEAPRDEPPPSTGSSPVRPPLSVPPMRPPAPPPHPAPMPTASQLPPIMNFGAGRETASPPSLRREIACPRCRRRLRVLRDRAGTVRCPICSATFEART